MEYNMWTVYYYLRHKFMFTGRQATLEELKSEFSLLTEEELVEAIFHFEDLVGQGRIKKRENPSESEFAQWWEYDKFRRAN